VFSHAKLANIQFQDSLLQDVQMENAQVINARFDSATIHRGKWRGTKPLRSFFIGAVFKETDLTEAEFSYSNLTGSSFKNAILSYSSFLHCEWQDNRFRRL